MEAPLLNGGGGGDYPPLRSWRDLKSMVWTETVKLWTVAGPLGFQILCQFGTDSMTSVFAGHIGNVELSAVSISFSVIGTFTFGFLVSFLFPLFPLFSFLACYLLLVPVCLFMILVVSFSYLGLCLVAEKQSKKKTKRGS